MTSLDTLLGDPYDPDNAYGVTGVLEADERREIMAGTRSVLDSYGFGAEFVPTALGGRFTSTERLIQLLRPVFGRDASLGLGYGLTSFMAAVNVYAAGRHDQKAAVAATLMSGTPISVAYHELDHGNDFGANALQATEDADIYRLNGTKSVINNADRSASAVVFARTGASGSGAGSTRCSWSISTVPTRPQRLPGIGAWLCAVVDSVDSTFGTRRWRPRTCWVHPAPQSNRPQVFPGVEMCGRGRRSGASRREPLRGRRFHFAKAPVRPRPFGSTARSAHSRIGFR
ncbi:hypothetical protein BJF84_07540 [Rhodococcus sp. CUA-806]|nr:hypothetical protein BJF84_07540 [Rhodococcus sp. CUA-806]